MSVLVAFLFNAMMPRLVLAAASAAAGTMAYKALRWPRADR